MGGQIKERLVISPLMSIWRGRAPCKGANVLNMNVKNKHVFQEAVRETATWTSFAPEMRDKHFSSLVLRSKERKQEMCTGKEQSTLRGKRNNTDTHKQQENNPIISREREVVIFARCFSLHVHAHSFPYKRQKKKSPFLWRLYISF